MAHSDPRKSATGNSLSPQPRDRPVLLRNTGTFHFAAAWSLLARKVPRPTAATSTRRSEDDSAAAVVGWDGALTLNVETASTR